MVLIAFRIEFNCKLKIINDVKNGKYAKENANGKMSFWPCDFFLMPQNTAVHIFFAKYLPLCTAGIIQLNIPTIN